MTDLRQTANYAAYLSRQNWLVKKSNQAYIFIRKIPLTPFSIIKIQRPSIIPFATISQLAKKYRAIAIYLEPLTTQQAAFAKQHGFRPKKSAFLPTKTIQIDLTQSEEKILKQMKKDTRYALRKAPKQDIKILRYKDIRKFHQSWKKTTGWQRWAPSLKSLKKLKKVFGQKVIFLAASSPADRIIAGTVILIANKRAYYYYAFTTKTGRRKLAQYHLVWQSIKLAKKQGCKIFDFEGIYDKRFPNKSWLGFSHFKKSFGGRQVEHPGCFVNARLRR